MTLEREFKVGDRVCSYEGKKGIVVKINGHRTIAELYTVSVEWDNPLHNRERCVYGAHSLWLEGQPEKESYGQRLLREEALRKSVKLDFKVADKVFYPNYGVGMILTLEGGNFLVGFANNVLLTIEPYPPLRLATPEDDLYQPPVFDPNAEPLDKTATLDDLSREVSRWTNIVQFLDGDDDDDEIRYDLYKRECIHGTLNGLKKQGIAVPAALLKALEDADQYFIENSVDYSAGENTRLEDDVFWYQNRWPKSKSKQGD